MDFDTCLKFIRDQAVKERLIPENIVETNILRVVRFSYRDGSGVLLTCSKLDNKLTLQYSAPR